ncbi:hypothetical protein VPH35_130210 [Triticum aestivum]|uniref:F-box domain-containing protein n=2 Tax=Triticum TaxID=4564 RepID=A0A9R1C2R3_TRITD|nr:uncharacterized protein LOC123161469 isoform X1 [Triticum aestivum]VAI89386.1 unnamed protein product [Triticum turgidum subsp. durum]
MEEGAHHGGLPELGPTGGGADLISALPEDLLLQVLACLRCARAATRTSLLSRRWSRLWTRLTGFTFRDLVLHSLQSALDSLVHAPGVFLLDIHSEVPPPVPRREVLYYLQYAAGVSSLLRAAAGLSPVELRFIVSLGPLARVTPDLLLCYPPKVDLPCFHRATSIDLSGLELELDLSLLADPLASRYMFPALEVLSLSRCCVDIADLLLHCPRLRVLRATDCSLGDTIRSASLQELVLEIKTRSVDIEVPTLKQLTLSLDTRCELRLSVLAPMMEKVLWLCHYSRVAAGIGLWGLAMVRFETESNALCLWMDCLHSFSFPGTELSLAQEILKHLVVCNFSVLDLHFNSFKTSGHAFGAFVFCLLAIHRIRTATKILKIGLGEKAIACPVYCPCDEPKNWRGETITLINLEEVEINVFKGQEHEFDFLRQIFKCTPMLKRIAVKLSDDVTTSNGSCTKIYDIFKEYPYVECSVVPSSGPEHSSQSGAST